MRRPSSGQPVVLDANVLKEWFLRLETPACRLAQELHESCVEFRYSNELAREAHSAIHRHGSPIRRETLTRFFGAADSKLGRVAQSKLDQVQLPASVRERLPQEDIHVVKLAVACRARCLVTRDGPLHESLMAVVDLLKLPSVHPELSPFDD